MAEEEALHEPTMEEILASIRRIISEDGEPIEAESQLEPAAELVAAPEPDFDENVLELTDAVQEVLELTNAMELVAGPAAIGGRGYGFDQALVSELTADSTTAAFSALAEAVADAKGVPLAREQTVEELARGLLRPMLKDWLDRNLEPIVVRAVEREISKLSGRADNN